MADFIYQEPFPVGEDKTKYRLLTKEYVKGRANIYVNPAVTEYNKTTDSANRTVTTLMKIIKGFAKEDEERDADYDPLMAIINGDSDGEE